LKISGRSTLREVTAIVASALRARGIQAVVSGGACASLHSGGVYQSEDIDLILMNAISQARLDLTLREVGFRRNGDRFVHSDTRFFVEFPRGPLAIGGDVRITPAEFRVRAHAFLVLSPTDSCRDRLAAFFHWGDRQSLRAALWIARRNDVDMRVIRRWSRAEGFAEAFEEFLAAVVKKESPRRLRGGRRRR
jgi:hypothetical protein